MPVCSVIVVQRTSITQLIGRNELCNECVSIKMKLKPKLVNQELL